MKAAPLLVAWHNDKAPIYSAQFDSHSNGRLATAGGDNNIRLWKIEVAGEERRVTYLSTLVKHTQAVNVVRWCPRGELLASAGDDGNILLWAHSDHHHGNFGEDDADDKETWVVKRMCRSSSGSEIYDLAWSPDGNYFITGSMDNSARIFDAQSGNMIRQLAEHNHYVQGVAWDPLNEFIATQSSDRSVHIWRLRTNDGQFSLSKHSKMARMDLPSRRPSSNSPAPPDFGHRSILQSVDAPNAPANPIGSPVPSAPGTPTSLPLPMNPPPPTSSHSRRTSRGNSSPSLRRSPSPAPSLPLPAVMPSPSPNPLVGMGSKNTSIYANETLTSFFRRLTFAPDGSLLFTPAGQYKTTQAANGDPSKTVEEIINTVYIYSRGGLSKPPVGHLPGHKKPSVAVRCSPVFYNLRLPATTKQITIDTSSLGEDIAPLPEPVMPTKIGSLSSMDPPSTAGAKSPTGGQTVSSPTKDADGKGLPDGPPPAFALPYRIVYAVATQDAVYVYDTQQQTPLCVVSNLHFATFTDLSWSHDGNTLLMTSSDGFCSYLSFSTGELGTTYHGSLSTRTQHHPTIINTSASTSTTPGPTPINSANLPTQIKHPSSAGWAPSPSPAASGRPMSPTRSNSASSITTQASNVVSNPAPSMSALPGVAAASPGAVTGPAPHASPTPPMTPASTSQAPSTSATASFSSATVAGATASVLGKREGELDPAAAGGDPQDTKKRRIAPTLVSNGSNDGADDPRKKA